MLNPDSSKDGALVSTLSETDGNVFYPDWGQALYTREQLVQARADGFAVRLDDSRSARWIITTEEEASTSTVGAAPTSSGGSDG